METVTQKEILITQLRRVCATVVSDAVASSARLEMSYMVDQLGTQLVAMIDLPKEAIKTVKGETSYEIPATWFDHLRLEFAPNFLTRKWPIRFRKQVVPWEAEVGAVYPQFKHAFPSEAENMRFYSLPKRPAYSMRKDGEDY